MNNYRHRPRSLHGQRGIVLITGLLLLVLITLVVLAASRSGRLQAVMSSNTRDRDLAFQAAEAALVDAEERLAFEFHAILADSINSNVENVAAGLLNRNSATLSASAKTSIIVQASKADYWVSPAGANGYGWFDANGAVNNSRSIATSHAIQGVDQQPRFAIEYLGTAAPSVDCTLPQTHYRYRITALAVGASTGSRKQADTRVLLQSEYRLCLEAS
ncbi:MAG: PilX N-terminal domain-containing pilus assembly protein [Burkholderiales bacterium]|nr:PilX N-terminal domain-containing pilus assembly protein [Burkholderiales bacterium]